MCSRHRRRGRNLAPPHQRAAGPARSTRTTADNNNGDSPRCARRAARGLLGGRRGGLHDALHQQRRVLHGQRVGLAAPVLPDGLRHRRAVGERGRLQRDVPLGVGLLARLQGPELRALLVLLAALGRPGDDAAGHPARRRAVLASGLRDELVQQRGPGAVPAGLHDGLRPDPRAPSAEPSSSPGAPAAAGALAEPVARLQLQRGLFRPRRAAAGPRRRLGLRQHGRARRLGQRARDRDALDRRALQRARRRAGRALARHPQAGRELRPDGPHLHHHGRLRRGLRRRRARHAQRRCLRRGLLLRRAEQHVAAAALHVRAQREPRGGARGHVR